MIDFRIFENFSLFGNEISVTWANTVTGKKSDAGFFYATNMELAINKLKQIIKTQLAVSIVSISNERKNAYQYSWTPKTQEEYKRKEAYIKLCEKCELFAKECYQRGFNDLMEKTNEFADSTLKKLIPCTSSKKYESIFDKVTKIRDFSAAAPAKLAGYISPAPAKN
ncbi:MAG TPA: hypothetical protein PLB59_04165 [Bacteroidales bacterium]|nr:hypothetical protein [Bacteroidales bacterium]HPB24872.1 hypothetical protein [Bacteroidales bacterium]HPI29504.1 hypothetical protein [Bacteroidales bacterium]HQN15600.1 hypothetical protein [Bacteroidales bacterium]HQP15141.1 hypothetical protein [Bacteroidales bacterium]